MKSKEQYDREWNKKKKTRHQENLRRLTGRFHGEFRFKGVPRGTRRAVRV